jgi:hypothetical protein
VEEEGLEGLSAESSGAVSLLYPLLLLLCCLRGLCCDCNHGWC